MPEFRDFKNTYDLLYWYTVWFMSFNLWIFEYKIKKNQINVLISILKINANKLNMVSQNHEEYIDI